MNTSNLSFKILDDTPSTKDDFDSHEKIAETISEVIRRNDGGKTVGLEGTWGSGKSTIITLLQEKYKNDKAIFFFSFDTWVHQGDPLRRAFLEALIAKAITRNWFSEKPRAASEDGKMNDKWTKKKEHLSSRVRTLVKETDPEIGGLYKLQLLSLLAAPAGSALSIATITKSNSVALDTWPLTGASWVFVIGLFLAVAPFLVLLLGLLSSGRDGKKRHRFWSVFFQKSHVSETIHTIESLDTSTIEFQNLFEEFMDDLLDDEEKKLVIVLDNLDRLPTKEGAEVWPVLRSFIDNPTFVKASWAKRLWVLIPYSRDALTVSKKEEDEATATAASAPAKVNGENTHQAADPHFLDKVFQISIFVPPPVLSNWRSYLEKLLREAFGEECDPETSHVIYLLFVRSYSAHTTPGPREIKNIINSMITTVMQWPSDIPLTHHAYFAILKHSRRGDELRVLLLSRKIPLHLDLLGEKTEESLVALEYNVPRQLASQMLYEPLIRRIFSDDSHHSDLLERCTDPGFSAQFDILIGEVLKSNAANPMLAVQNMALLCSEDFIKKITVSSKRNVIREVSKAIEELHYLPLNLPNLVPSIEMLAKADAEKLASRSFSKVIVRTLAYYSSDKNSAVFGFTDRHLGKRSVLETAYALRTSLTIQTYSSLENPIAFGFSGNVDDFLSAEKHFRNESAAQLLDIFEFSSVAEKLTDEIVFRRSESRRLLEIVELLRYLSDRKTKLASNIFSDVVSRMARDRSMGYDSIHFALPYFFELQSENAAVKESLSKPALVDFAYHYLGIYNPRLPEDLTFEGGNTWLISRMPIEEKIDTCARLIYLLLINQEIAEREQKNGYIIRGKKFYERVVAKPERHPLIVNALYRLAKNHGDLTLLQKNLSNDNREVLHAMLSPKDQALQ